MTGHFLTHAVALMAAAIARGLQASGNPLSFDTDRVIRDAKEFLRFMNGHFDAER